MLQKDAEHLQLLRDLLKGLTGWVLQGLSLGQHSKSSCQNAVVLLAPVKHPHQTGSFLLQVWAAGLDVDVCYYPWCWPNSGQTEVFFPCRRLFLHIVPTSTFMVGTTVISPSCRCYRLTIGSRAVLFVGCAMVFLKALGPIIILTENSKDDAAAMASGMCIGFLHVNKQGGEGILTLTQVCLQPLCSSQAWEYLAASRQPGWIICFITIYI